MKRNGILVVMLVLALTVFVFSCAKKEAGGEAAQPATEVNADGIPADGPSYTLQLAMAAADANEMSVFVHEIKDQLEARSGGKITVDLYPNSQLGGDRELTEGCQAGNIAMVVQATSPQVSFIPAVAVFDLPSAMTDIDATYRAMSGPFGQKMAAEYAKGSLQLLVIYPVGCREMTSNKPVRKFEDFKGIKIRTMENQYHIMYWKALGANPTPLNFAELYIALQQGLVDAQENPPMAVIATKLYEQQKYLINTNHIMFLTTVVMNKALFDGMPEAYRNLILTVLDTAAKNNIALMKANAAKNLDFLRGQGLEIIDLSPETMAQMQTAAKPVYDMIRKSVGDDLVDSLLSALK